MTDTTPQATVVVERTYRAALDALWALWTTKDGFESWWGPEGFRVAVHTIEARAGGAIVYDMIADTPEMIDCMKRMGQPVSHVTRGRFAAFEPLVHLTLVHVIDFIAGTEPYESTIEVAFQALGDHSRMVVTVHPHRDPHWTSMANQGFASQLTKLDKRFGAAG